MPEAFAHRGLWSPGGPPENSMAAFRAAADAGLGIELDVQLSRDGVPIVFHDPMLDRMTAESGAVWNHDAETLNTITLGGSGETIPWLSQVVQELPAGTPILVELKPSPGDPSDYAGAVSLALFNARVDAAIMSFNLPICEAIHDAVPHQRRGLLLPALSTLSDSALIDRLEASRRFGMDYLAIQPRDVDRVRDHVGSQLPIFVWTVDDEHTLASVKPVVQGIIFEHLSPELVIGA